MPSLEQLKLTYKLADFELLHKDGYFDQHLRISFDGKYVEIVYDDTIRTLPIKNFDTLIMRPAIHSILSK